MVSVPATSPVTVPPATEARVFAVLHVPPVIVSVKVITAPVHTSEGPAIAPAYGNGFMITGIDVSAVPHELVTK